MKYNVQLLLDKQPLKELAKAGESCDDIVIAIRQREQKSKDHAKRKT